jgi:hypothetical protein
VNRANGHDTSHRRFGAMNRDAVTFDLLIEQGRHRAGHPPQRQIAVWPDPPNHIARLIQGADNQAAAPAGAAPQLEEGIPAPIATGSGYKAKNRVDCRVLVPGYCGERYESNSKIGKVLEILRVSGRDCHRRQQHRSA